MIIETRYRDIPWEQFWKCAPGGEMTAANWEQWRGKAIQISTPARITDMRESGRFICEGPLFEVMRPSVKEGKWVAACPHIAEIGD